MRRRKKEEGEKKGETEEIWLEHRREVGSLQRKEREDIPERERERERKRKEKEKERAV